MTRPDDSRARVNITGGKIPRLSVCVPSRNRQACFQQTILDLLTCTRDDIEFVLADNSDDPSIMDQFVAALGDPRIRYLSSPETVLPMIGNWERIVAAARGEWVCVIGDDDFVDLGVVEMIGNIEKQIPSIEAIGWYRAAFEWPDARSGQKTTSITLAHKLTRLPQESLKHALFGWVGATYMPACPFTIYHGAVRHSVIDAMLVKSKGRYFENPVVDYDFCHRLVTTAQAFVFIDRPMSILGVAKGSNSAAVGNANKSAQAVKAWESENGFSLAEKAAQSGFPFHAGHGVAASIMAAQHEFKTRHGFHHDHWQGGFIQAVNLECGLWHDRNEFDRHVASLRSCFAQWEGGRYLPYFKPEYVPDDHRDSYLGVDRNGRLHLNQGIADRPATMQSIFRDILPEVATLAFTG